LAKESFSYNLRKIPNFKELFEPYFDQIKGIPTIEEASTATETSDASIS
jgi:hypothetical protein